MSTEMDNEYGKEITLQEGEVIIDLHRKIKKRVNQKIKELLEDTKNDDAKKLFTSEYNAFIFSRKLVERFFKGDAGAKDPNEEAEYLMVILGAHPKDDEPFEKNDPTVVMVGCNRKEVNGEITFVSLGRAKPANEHPPQIVIEDIPFEKDGITKFKLL